MERPCDFAHARLFRSVAHVTNTNRHPTTAAKAAAKSTAARIASASLAVAVACDFANAGRIAIINPGFELTSRPLIDGEITNGCGGAGVTVGTRMPFRGSGVSFANPVEVPGWRTYLPPPNNPNATIWAGVLNPPVMNTINGPQPFLANMEGQHVAAAQVSWMQQTLNVKVRPSTRYQLRFRAGNGLFDLGEGVYVSLLASPDLQTLAFLNTPNVTTLALTQGVGIPPGSTGSMTQFQIEYVSPRILPANVSNRYLAISLIGSDGIPRMCFDDFQLTAIPVASVHALTPFMLSAP